jgi:hypothetical protein
MMCTNPTPSPAFITLKIKTVAVQSGYAGGGNASLIRPVQKPLTTNPAGGKHDIVSQDAEGQ